MLFSGGQFVHLEGLLLGLLPLWLGILSSKLIISSAGFVGTYLLSRRGGGCPRGIALGLAALMSTWVEFSTMTSIAFGIGLSSVPLAVYLIVVRADRATPTRYWIPVLLFAGVHATSTTPTHTMLGLLSCLVLASISFGTRCWKRVAAGILAVIGFVLLNWFDVLAAMAHMAAASSRSDVVPLGLEQLTWDSWRKNIHPVPTLPIALAASLAALWLKRDTAAPRQSFALVAGLVAPAVAMAFPWQAIGLPMLGGILWARIIWGEHALVAIALARLAAGPVPLAALAVPSSRWLAALIWATATGHMMFDKGTVAVFYPGAGGQSLLYAIPNLKERDWTSEKPFRVVSIDFRLRANMPLAYGLETRDSTVNLRAHEDFLYWRAVLNSAPRRTIPIDDAQLNNRHGFAYGDLDGSRREFDFEAWANIDLLRLGNVDFVLSPVPLTGEGLTQVSGPREFTPRHARPVEDRLIHGITQIVRPDPIRVYALPPSVPRAFFARRIVVVPDDMGDKDFYAATAKHGLEQEAVVRRDYASRLIGPISASARVLSVAAVQGGYDVEISAPSAGVLVLNTIAVPFWRATVDEKPASPVPVNGIHMAVTVPEGARTVRFRYENGLRFVRPQAGAGP
jgi:hypothetical protein